MLNLNQIIIIDFINQTGSTNNSFAQIRRIFCKKLYNLWFYKHMKSVCIVDLHVTTDELRSYQRAPDLFFGKKYLGKPEVTVIHDYIENLQ